MKKFRRIVRRNLRANKRTRRPSWTPVEQPFEERAPELIDLSDHGLPDTIEEPT